MQLQLQLHDPYSPRSALLWQALETSHPRSYFLSWAFMENWLSAIPRDEAPRLATLTDTNARPVAAFLLGRRFHVRSRIVPTRAAFLNITGKPHFDQHCIEYNGIVGAALGLDQLVEALPAGWDELFLPALEDSALAITPALGERGYRVRVDRQVPVYFVPLDRVRAGGYPPRLSGQTRGQLRRAQREAGPSEVELARDLTHALDIYDELCTLHNASWRARGQPGAFSDPWFYNLHRRLIERRLAHGEIQLLRVRTASGTLGCLYNFVHRGRVLQYQSGFARIADPHLKPGFICHAAAIEASAAQGLAIYDFLGGAARYKKSLSTQATSLTWVRVQRPRLRFAVEQQLRAARELARRIIDGSPPPVATSTAAA